jgi:hypothetical protein
LATVAHVAVGLAAARLAAVGTRRPRGVQLAFGLLALLPDLDAVLPRLHHDGSAGRLHSPAVSILASAVATELAGRAGLSRRRSFLSAAIALGSQPAFDWLTHRTGVPVLWPVSGRRFARESPPLPTWEPQWGLSRSGLRTFLRELAWSVPMLALAALPFPAAGEQERARWVEPDPHVVQP